MAMMGRGSITKSMVMVARNIQPARCMKVCSERVCAMVRANTPGAMVASMMVAGTKARKMVTATSWTEMECAEGASGLMVANAKPGSVRTMVIPHAMS